MKGGDKSKSSGIKKIFSKFMKKRPKDKEDDSTTVRKEKHSQTHNLSSNKAPAPRHSPASGLDGYWPEQRRPHPLTTRLPQAGTVQDLVEWFDQKPADPSDRRPYTRRPPEATVGVHSQDSRTPVHANKDENTRHNVVMAQCPSRYSPVREAPPQSSYTTDYHPQPQRQSYYTSTENVRRMVPERNIPPDAQMVQYKVEAYLERLPVNEISRSSSMPSVGPNHMPGPSGPLGEQQPQTHQALYLGHSDIQSYVADSDDVSDVTTIVPVDSSVRSMSGQHPEVSQVERPVVHYHLSIKNCNGINIHVNNTHGDQSQLPNTFQVDDAGAFRRLSWVEEAPPACDPTFQADKERYKYFSSAPSRKPVAEEVPVMKEESIADTASKSKETTSTGGDEKDKVSRSKGKGVGKGKKDKQKSHPTKGDKAPTSPSCKSPSSKSVGNLQKGEKKTSPTGAKTVAVQDPRTSLSLPSNTSNHTCQIRNETNSGPIHSSAMGSAFKANTSGRRSEVQHSKFQKTSSEKSQLCPQDAQAADTSAKEEPQTTNSVCNCQSSQIASPCETDVPSESPYADTSICTGVMSPPPLTASPNMGSNLVRPKPQKSVPVGSTDTAVETVMPGPVNSQTPAAFSQPSTSDSVVHHHNNSLNSHRSSTESITTDILMSECDSCQRDVKEEQSEAMPSLGYADNAVEVLTRERHRPVALVAPSIREIDRPSRTTATESLVTPNQQQPVAVPVPHVTLISPLQNSVISSVTSHHPSPSSTVSNPQQSPVLSLASPSQSAVVPSPQQQQPTAAAAVAPIHIEIVQQPNQTQQAAIEELSPLPSAPSSPVSLTGLSSPVSPTSPASQDSNVPSEIVYFHQLQQYQLQQQQLIQQELLNLEQRRELDQLGHPSPMAQHSSINSRAEAERGRAGRGSTGLHGVDSVHRASAHATNIFIGHMPSASGTVSSSNFDHQNQQRRQRRRRQAAQSEDTNPFSSVPCSSVRQHISTTASLLSASGGASSDGLITASSTGGRFRRTRSAPRRIHRSREETLEEEPRQHVTRQRTAMVHHTDLDAAHSDNEDDRLPDRFNHLKSQMIRLPGVLILGTRRGRLIVYLSRDRPNIEGVVNFMMQHGIARHEYECKVLPSRFRVRQPGVIGQRCLAALMAQA